MGSWPWINCVSGKGSPEPVQADFNRWHLGVLDVVSAADASFPRELVSQYRLCVLCSTFGSKLAPRPRPELRSLIGHESRGGAY